MTLSLKLASSGGAPFGSRRIGLTRLHNGHADTVVCAVVAGVPGCQGVGTDAPGIGYGHIGAKVAVRVTSRARIARRDLAIQQEGNRRIAGKLLPADMQDRPVCSCQSIAHLILAGDADERLAGVKGNGLLLQSHLPQPPPRLSLQAGWS